MAITIANLRFQPYQQKDAYKPIFGGTLDFDFILPTPHVTGDKYLLACDWEKVVYPPARPLCAYSEAYELNETEEGTVLSMSLKFVTGRFREYVCKLKKPTPITLQLIRIRGNRQETLLLDDILALPSIADGKNIVVEGDPLDEILETKMDTPKTEGTEGQVLSLDANGNAVWRDEQEIPEQVQTDWDESDSDSPAFLVNRPNLSKVAISGSYTDLSDKPDLTVYEKKEDLATVAESGNYADLSNKPDLSVYAEKSELATVATTGAYGDLTGTPALATVATTGDYNDLLNKPVIPEQVQSDFDESDSDSPAYIKNRPDLTVFVEKEVGKGLSTNDFTDADKTKLANIEAGAQVNVKANWDESDSDADSFIVGKPSFANVAFSGDYADLSGKPVIPPDDTDYLCFTANTNGSTVYLRKNGSPNDITLETSTDGVNWTTYTLMDTITLTTAGDKVYFRGDNATFSTGNTAVYYFQMSGSINASGNVMSLLDKTCRQTSVPNWAFANLFYMCTSLVKPPRLPATGLGERAYYSMFFGCTSLTTAPELPATTLANSCYQAMFYGCTSLAVAPDLPATTLAGSCYEFMFYNCPNINKVKVAFASWGSNNNWLSGASATGTFYCPSALDGSVRDVSHVPSGWSIVRTDSVTPDWNASSTSPAYIANKPDINALIADALTIHNN